MRGTAEQRLCAKVDKRGPDECWPWTGGRGDRWGRGYIHIGKRKVPATWVALEAAGKSRPTEAHHACHTCDNPLCVNPDHLWWGTHSDNMQDKASKGRHHSSLKTHCPSGHPYSGDNLSTASGYRECLTCRRAQSRAYKERAHA